MAAANNQLTIDPKDEKNASSGTPTHAIIAFEELGFTSDGTGKA